MGRKGAASPEGLRATGDGLAGKTASHARWPFGVKGSVLAVAVLALLGILAFAATREATTTVRGPIPAVSRPPPRHKSRPSPAPRRHTSRHYGRSMVKSREARFA